MNHKELVAKAKVWLACSKGCNPVFTERGSAQNNEFPDAVGWNSGDCIVVECKISIEDFRADLKKDFRLNNEGMGAYRYYLMPDDIYEKVRTEIPKGWGIITADRYSSVLSRQERGRGSDKFESNIIAERNFLRSRILEIQRFGT
jgi:hypothetical protein